MHSVSINEICRGAVIISNISDETDSDEDMRKDEPPKFRVLSMLGAGSADKICRTVTLSDELF